METMQLKHILEKETNIDEGELGDLVIKSETEETQK